MRMIEMILSKENVEKVMTGLSTLFRTNFMRSDSF